MIGKKRKYEGVNKPIKSSERVSEKNTRRKNKKEEWRTM